MTAPSPSSSSSNATPRQMFSATLLQPPSTAVALDTRKPINGFQHSVDDVIDDDLEDPEAWDTAHEGDGDGFLSEEERSRSQLLKGKAKAVAVSATQERSSLDLSEQPTTNGSHRRPLHARHLSMSTPPPTSSPASSCNPVISSPNGPSTSGIQLNPDASSDGHLATSSVPSFNVIPTSPQAHPVVRDPGDRQPASSLDISPPTLPVSRSQESIRRRGTMDPIPSTEHRNNRHRSFEHRTNRLSGFFSNLLHMRPNDHRNVGNHQSAPSSTSAPASSSHSPSRKHTSRPADREIPSPVVTPEPVPPPRAPTPPPPLSPPALEELGLEMMTIAPFIQASGITCPPVSGVFLAPHFLLLCHEQGLDVLPVKGPPAPHPYALIRRVAFKSVLVMEERGVIVAIAGRREGVRVYSLDEVRKAVEWRMQVEIEREREKESMPKNLEGHPQWGGMFGLGKRSMDRDRFEDVREGLSIGSAVPAEFMKHRARVASSMIVSSTPATPSSTTPHPPSEQIRRRRSSLPTSPPPSYSTISPMTATSGQNIESSYSQPNGNPIPSISEQASSSTHTLTTSLSVPEEGGTGRTRGASVSTIAPARLGRGKGKEVGIEEAGIEGDDQEKSHWMRRHGDSDDEALDPVAAGPSASAALDERTSAMMAAAADQDVDDEATVPVATLPPATSVRSAPPPSMSSRRQTRPSDLDLSPNTLGPSNLGFVSSPAPTLKSMRQALSYTGTVRPPFAPRSPRASTSLSLSGGDDAGGGPAAEMPQHEVGEDFISFAQAMAESRLPPAPPLRVGSPPPLFVPPVPASAVISALGSNQQPSGTRRSEERPPSPAGTTKSEDKRKKRRFSIMGVPFGKGGSGLPNGAVPGSSRNFTNPVPPLPGAAASTPNLHDMTASSAPIAALPSQANGLFGAPRQPLTPVQPQSASAASIRLQPPTTINTVDRIFHPQMTHCDPTELPIKMPQSAPISGASLPGSSSSTSLAEPAPRHSRRFLPKLLTGFKKSHEARNSREPLRPKSEVERRLAAGGAMSFAAMTNGSDPSLGGRSGENGPSVSVSQTPAPKLEYVKLPGTKGAISIKAVETSKKSFLAILCGDSGEKIELFAGTYKTALSLSRTFILPDSPRSLELQLQGDDLVELFLVFTQNVFGLEPATVRVREVRIGRAERRAARRRAREARGLAASEGAEETQAADESQPTETVVTSTVTVGDDGEPRPRPSYSGSSQEAVSVATLPPPASGEVGAREEAAPTTTTTASAGPSQEEAAAVAAATRDGPYTTFQQLSYAPAFPLSTIGDDYVIPPTYPDFLNYRDTHEPDVTSISNLLAGPSSSSCNTTPQPAPAEAAPPPPAALPPTWYYIDPKGVIQGPWKTSLMQSWFNDDFLPLDLPVRRDSETEYTPLNVLCSAAEDPKRPFQPHALTDSLPPPPQPPPIRQTTLRPISLLAQPKRFGPPALFYTSRGGHSTAIVDSRGKSVLRGRLHWTVDDEMTKLGDIKRLEAFDAHNRAVIVALRQGGVEALDVGDALSQSGDDFRASLPYLHNDPATISRRPPFSWKLGGTIGHPGPRPQPPLEQYENSPHISKRSTIPGEKATTIPSHHHHRAAAKSDSNAFDDEDGALEEEILFLGRYDDKIYFCERNLRTFRILSLGTIT